MPVVNKHHGLSYDIDIGRPHILGNPFAIGRDGSRDDVIAAYRQYALRRLSWDAEFKAAIIATKGKTLGCYCKPLACHGDVIEELAKNEN